nr:unnamed protein product [Callosobruchus chinensis]
MERSQSNVYSSTFSDGLDRIGDVDHGILDKRHIVAKIGIGLVELLTSATFFSYGIFISHQVINDHYSLEGCVWTTVLFWTGWYLTAPWSRVISERLDEHHDHFFQLVIGAATICLFVAIVLPWHQLGFGILGGRYFIGE